MSVINKYTIQDLPVHKTNQPKVIDFDEYQRSTQVRTKLDTFEEDFNRDGFFKVVAFDSHNRDTGEATVVLETTEDRSKWAMFKDWCSHAVGRFTDRDKQKFDTAKVVTNTIRDELIELYPDASAEKINQGTESIIRRSTDNKVILNINGHDKDKVTPKDKFIDTSYQSKYPHAFNAHELLLANNMLHNAKVLGIPHLGVAPSNL